MAEVALLVIYASLLTVILIYCLLELALAWRYWRSKRRRVEPPRYLAGSLPAEAHPLVTIQLPLYNERYVVDRLLRAVAAIDYPRTRFAVQVLDDSDDATVELVDELVAELKTTGLQIEAVRRPQRSGFKAGALQYGLQRCSGEFVAIFDADFVPDPQFLRRTVPYLLTDKKTGMVQTRWTHLNKFYSPLTRIQAFFLDNHFAVEQAGRNSAGYFINFNGTAGVWRKTCIEDAGGWQADTITEDLDLSYRAQLRGWRFAYLEHVGSPAELPADMPSFKSQQFRWIKGGAETAVKLLPQIARSSYSPAVKVNAFSHLLSSSIYLVIFLTVFFSLPLLIYKNSVLELDYYTCATPFMLSNIAVALIYFASIYKRADKWRSLLEYLTVLPVFLIVTMGMSLHNTLAVVRGFLGEKTPFVRTPKFDLKTQSDSWQSKTYATENRHLDLVVWLELAMVVYLTAGIVYGVWVGEWFMLPLHLMALAGFTTVAFYSIRHSRI